MEKLCVLKLHCRNKQQRHFQMNLGAKDLRFQDQISIAAFSIPNKESTSYYNENLANYMNPGFVFLGLFHGCL